MGKTYKGKAKVRAKITQAKRKIARKVKGCAALALALFICGCMETQPASRATTATYGDIAAAAGQKEEARKAYEQALKLKPANAESLRQRLGDL